MATDLAAAAFGVAHFLAPPCMPIIVAALWTASVALGDFLDVGSLDAFDTIHHSGPLALSVIGFLILPITTLQAATSTPLLSIVNPIDWFRSIRRIGTPLLVGAPCFYAFVFFEYLVVHPLATSCWSSRWRVGCSDSSSSTWPWRSGPGFFLGSLIIGRL